MNNLIKQVPHVAQKPLSIEREYMLNGLELLVIEGVRYDANVLRAFADPAPDALYLIRRDGERVSLTPIRNAEEASEFFNETFGRVDPASTEDDQDGL